MEQIYIFLDNEPWLSIVVFAILQLAAFGSTISKLIRYKRFFPGNSAWQTTMLGNSYQILVPEDSDGVKELVSGINEYLYKNEGTADFSIIKDKTERKLEMLYDDAVSKISYPTYLGLMGTFFGVFIGLKSFNIGVAAAGVTDNVVSELIGGVIVSMVTSLVGLILMMIGNWVASGYQKNVEADKNKFYDFLQVELMPAMGTSMVSALNKLHQTINTFEPAFRGIIVEFKGAFSECTDMLKGSFGENVKQLTDAVDVMGKNMTLIDDNVKKQDELLQTMRQRQTLDTLVKFNEAADKFDSVTTSIVKLSDVKDDIARASENLIKAQSDYVEKMSIPERVFEKVNDILNRISTFEDSINALGRDIESTQLFGNTQMNLIEEQITAIKKKTNLAVAYQETADEQLKGIYDEQSQAIESINAQYRAAIERHGEDFESAMSDFKAAYSKIINECKLAVQEKRDEFISEIRKSLDLEAKSQHLAHLDVLDGMNITLDDIRASVKEQPELMGKLDEMLKQLGNISKPTSQLYRTQEVQKDNIDHEIPQKPKKRGFFKRVFGRK